MCLIKITSSSIYCDCFILAGEAEHTSAAKMAKVEDVEHVTSEVRSEERSASPCGSKLMHAYNN